jgi:peptidoglycan/LPS O-acetylase OafA/YrhL
VDLFFVLSGFLITGILLDARGAPHFFRDFYARRVLRIFPLYYAALLGLTVAGAVVAVRTGHAPLVPTLWCWLYVTNVAVGFFPGAEGPYYVGHFWSLAVEEQFYLGWPLVVAWLGARRLGAVCLWILAAGLALRVGMVVGGAPPMATYVLTPARLDALAAGGLLACWARDGAGKGSWAGRASVPAFWVALAVFVAAMALQRSPRADGPWVLTVGLSAAAVASGALIQHVVAGVPAGRVASALRAPWLVRLGALSYGLYVIHYPVHHLLTRLPAATPFAVLGSAVPYALARTLVGIALTYAIAWLSWNLLERRFLALKARFR